NAATASRTTVRLTPVAAIISCSVGSCEPGASLPLVMSAVSRATSSAVSRRGALSGCSSARFFGARLGKGLTPGEVVRSSYDLMNNKAARNDQPRPAASKPNSSALAPAHIAAASGGSQYEISHSLVGLRVRIGEL